RRLERRLGRPRRSGDGQRAARLPGRPPPGAPDGAGREPGVGHGQPRLRHRHRQRSGGDRADRGGAQSPWRPRAPPDAHGPASPAETTVRPGTLLTLDWMATDPLGLASYGGTWSIPAAGIPSTPLAGTQTTLSGSVTAVVPHEQPAGPVSFHGTVSGFLGQTA